MKILHVNYYDTQGGAAKAACRLHQALLDAKHESIMLVAEKKSNDDYVVEAFSPGKLRCLHIKQRLEVALTSLCRKQHRFPHSLNIFKSGLADKINSVNPDIVNLHWINGCMMSIKEIGQIKAPIVWTLHDGWAYCGAEHHHQHKDERFKTGYDQSSVFDLNRHVWKQKMKYWNKLDIDIVTPSSWLGDEAKESCVMANKSVHVIPNGVDLNIFKADNIKAVQKDKKTIAFGAFDINDWNKGGKELSEALSLLQDKYKDKLELLLIGNGHFESKFKSKNTGFVDSDEDIAKIYPKADVFVLASKYDNLPNMLIEAAACNVPVVAFDTGGIADIVEHKKNGYLAKAFDCEDFANGISWVLENPKYEKNCKTARKTVEDKFDVKKVAEQYLKLYKKVLETNE